MRNDGSKILSLLLGQVLLVSVIACGASHLPRDKALRIAASIYESAKRLQESRRIEPHLGKDLLLIDKITALCSVYYEYLPPASQAWVYEAAMSLPPQGDFPTVYSAYTPSGLHFIALQPPTMRHSFDFDPAVDFIGPSPTEADFLYRLNTEGLYALDFFAEDLSASPSRKILGSVNVYTKDGEERVLVQARSAPPSGAAAHLLQTSKRSLSTNTSIALNSWQLIALEREIGWPEIVVLLSNESVALHKLDGTRRCRH